MQKKKITWNNTRILNGRLTYTPFSRISAHMEEEKEEKESESRKNRLII